MNNGVKFMEIGKKIKQLRTAKGMTQETLAAELAVTPQAISKWECDITMPDIQLLPKLAILFGVTIDELFCLTDENELDRIQNMIWDERMLPQAELERAERFLTAKINAGYRAGRCYCLLAQLHNHQAQQHHILAAGHARKALAHSPEEKDAHSELCEAMGGRMPDWCARNHHTLIDFYKSFIDKNPGYRGGYLWLLDNLIDNRRLDEAWDYLGRMEKIDASYRVPLYRSLILDAEGKQAEAAGCLSKMEREFPDEWLVSLSLGDLAAGRQRYDEAITYYRKALTQQKAPRFADAYDSIAQVCELRGDISGAINAYEEELELFRTEWNFSEGETADKLRREIDRLRKLQ